jgi:HAD superfamily hydrolase (TIGR01509 family)
VSGDLADLAAVFFDMDGLLIDSEPLWFEVECAVMERLGASWGPEHQAELVGGSMERTVSYMLSVSGSDVPPETVEAWLVDGMAEVVRRGVRIQPGAAELLVALSAAGVPAALVSSTYRELMDVVLDQLAQAGHFFAVTIAGDEVRARKPDPEAYLHAAASLGVPPARCVVLEDSDNGARAGVAAGCPTIVVPSVASVPEGPGRVFRDSLVGVTVDWLAGLAGSALVGD